MDTMHVKGMKFYGYHGVFSEENKLGQQFIVDISLKMDMDKAIATDELVYALDYSELYTYIQNIVEGPPFRLIEALTGHIAVKLLQHYTVIEEVTVSVTKPNPPFKVFFEGVTIEVTRKRERND